MSWAASLQLHAFRSFPDVEPGDDLVAHLVGCIRADQIEIRPDDIFVLAQKIVSKAEGRYVNIADVVASDRAVEIARATGKDPRHVEVVLSESTDIVRTSEHLLIVEHRLGLVMANAGVDQSNVDHADGEKFLLLPSNPDLSARSLKEGLEAQLDMRLGVVINDSFGRPWRNGIVGVAIGAAGVQSLESRIGQHDMFGRPLRITEIAIADEIASAASLLMGQAGERRPVVLVRGLGHTGDSPASALIRDRKRDLFR